MNIAPDQSIQPLVNMYPGGTTFCLRAGVHRLTSSVTPKTGNTFVGEYGAILDGSNWKTSDPNAAAFMAMNVDVDSVTVRNLAIRHMPQHGITVWYQDSNNWKIENNEIDHNKFGLEFSANTTLRNNYIHHNVSSTPNSSKPAERGGGYICQHCDSSLIENNEIAYNGPEQKVALSVGIVFRNNFFHHNMMDGIWYDTNPNAGALIEGNRVEDNGRDGISFEASIGATIRNNTVRRNADAAVFISMSQNAQIYNNSLEANVGGIEYFLNCDSLSSGEDVKNNAAYDNTVVIGTQTSAHANGFRSTSCAPEQLMPYLNGAKKLTFSHNAYRLPSAAFSLLWGSGRYFLWGGSKSWNEWQAVGHDVEGRLSQ